MQLMAVPVVEKLPRGMGILLANKSLEISACNRRAIVWLFCFDSRLIGCVERLFLLRAGNCNAVTRRWP